jgi:ferric-dicitrate binding protein FerR (iron transport regulator)
MSATLKQETAAAKPDTVMPFAAPQHSRVGPSRRRRRANGRLSNAVALCAMGAWAVVGLMPVIAALYAIYGY